MADVEVREDGASVVVAAGDRIVVRLPENASTGYQWRVSALPDSMEVESSDLDLASDLAPGAGGERVFVLRTRARGRTEVVLTLDRAWEIREPVDRVHVDVSVT